MSRIVFEFHNPERFLIGTVGVPGEREFYLQIKGVSQGRNLLASFGLEKAQASALAQRCRQIIKEVSPNLEAPIADLAALETPVESEFSLGVMSISWTPQEELFLFEGQSMADPETDEIFEELVSDETPGAPAIVRARLRGEDLLMFARRAELVVSAGRQPCVFCGGPLNPGGHLCPRSNGYRRRD